MAKRKSKKVPVDVPEKTDGLQQTPERRFGLAPSRAHGLRRDPFSPLWQIESVEDLISFGEKVRKAGKNFPDAHNPFEPVPVLDPELSRYVADVGPVDRTAAKHVAARIDFDAPLGPNGEIPLVKPRRVDWDGMLEVRLKVPSVVVRIDGRYGVARPMLPGDESVLGPETRPQGESSCSTRMFHEPISWATRSEAERRCWALARELARTEDWP